MVFSSERVQKFSIQGDEFYKTTLLHESGVVVVVNDSAMKMSSRQILN